jgi:hypothetical protein
VEDKNDTVEFHISQEFTSIVCGVDTCGQEFLLFGIIRHRERNYEGEPVVDVWPQVASDYCPYCGGMNSSNGKD